MLSGVQILTKQPAARTLIPIGDHNFRGDNPRNFGKIWGPPPRTPLPLTSPWSPERPIFQVQHVLTRETVQEITPIVG